MPPVVPPPPGIIPNTRIQKLLLNDSLGANRAGIFIYANGNPIRIHFLETATGNPYFEFNYDKYGRLAESISIYNNGSYEAWRRYFYDASSRIVLEFANVFGNMSESPNPVGNLTHYTEFQYDAQNRISQYAVHAGGSPTITTCTYNAQGNLDIAGASYDSQVNYRRTNAIWMFLDRDYSLNNRLGATSYNAQGLPLGFQAVTPPQNVKFLSKELVGSVITY